MKKFNYLMLDDRKNYLKDLIKIALNLDEHIKTYFTKQKKTKKSMSKTF